ncbi:MAG: hypothetical protein RQ733_03470 [Methyloprofundus sp.]|nr:hypothetical protein [Methyloprofundus sp.]
MNAPLIKLLLPYLPRHAEEDGDFFSVPRVELVQHLMTAGYAQDIADNTLEMLENLLATLATLNPDALQQGEWCFFVYQSVLR